MAIPISISPFKHPRALVVDDSTTLQRLLDLTLRPLGVEVEFAARGDDAIALALSKSYDVIFLDVMLPGADGYQVCKAVKRDERAKHVAVIMLTSKDSAFDKVKGIMAGTNAYLTKPVDRTKLLAALQLHAPGLLAAGAFWLERHATTHRLRQGNARAANSAPDSIQQSNFQKDAQQ
jgi:two-component system cell cycle response regulator